MTTCAYCGRANDAGAQYCMDCGKPLTKAAAAAAKQAAAAAPAATPSGSGNAQLQSSDIGTLASGQGCPFCGEPVDGVQPYCPHCGRRLSAPGSGPACARCGAPVKLGAKFCATCGATLDAGLSRPSSRPAPRMEFLVKLVLLDEIGHAVKTFDSTRRDTTLGRQDGDVRFPDDPFLSPMHAKLSWEDDRLMVRDLGSRNGTWVFLEEPYRLMDGDLLLVGSQIFRFRRLGYPGPFAPEADATKRMGSLIPSADIASLVQLRADGSSRDVIQLSPGRDVLIGRERGDWIFPYDPSMSGQHAQIRSEDADFVLVDAGSRNGVAIAARGAMPLKDGSRILVGDKLLRVEIPA
ncbi:MAG: FHA domain-containing protein [Chloroflexi bacterium]|nr:MAG: FHA domain-containing protein [Chloroflexota bacterium]